jgi:hypothetical protein
MTASLQYEERSPPPPPHHHGSVNTSLLTIKTGCILPHNHQFLLRTKIANNKKKMNIYVVLALMASCLSEASGLRLVAHKGGVLVPKETPEVAEARAMHEDAMQEAREIHEAALEEAKADTEDAFADEEKSLYFRGYGGRTPGRTHGRRRTLGYGRTPGYGHSLAYGDSLYYDRPLLGYGRVQRKGYGGLAYGHGRMRGYGGLGRRSFGLLGYDQDADIEERKLRGGKGGFGMRKGYSDEEEREFRAERGPSA